jgi:lipoprotein-anchoring transpeptidase ErfK/SrfK
MTRNHYEMPSERLTRERANRPAPARRPRPPRNSRRRWAGFVAFMVVSLCSLIACAWLTASPAAPSHLASAASNTKSAPAAPPAKAPAATQAVVADAPATTLPAPVPTTVAPGAAACAATPAGEKQVVVSISSQALWACDGSQMVNTSPVTTGADNSTPRGTYRVQAIEGPQYLNGCNSSGCWHDWVHVWIPFDGPYGFHDAPWQTMPFGAPGYTTQGSHGCVHLPMAEATWVSNWIAVGTRVTIED